MLDEAEQMLGATASGQCRKVQSVLKECVSDIKAKNTEVYLFAVTNRPEDIDLSHGWNWRLRHKMHVQLPGHAGREMVVKKA